MKSVMNVRVIVNTKDCRSLAKSMEKADVFCLF